jgi:muconolactone D-isomerase
MLFFCKVRVDHTRISDEELWDLWEKEVKEALHAKSTGTIVAVYKVAAQRRVIMIIDVPDHDFFDRLGMGMMPMRHIFEVEEILARREYESFAKDVEKRWKS